MKGSKSYKHSHSVFFAHHFILTGVWFDVGDMGLLIHHEILNTNNEMLHVTSSESVIFHILYKMTAENTQLLAMLMIMIKMITYSIN